MLKRQAKNDIKIYMYIGLSLSVFRYNVPDLGSISEELNEGFPSTSWAMRQLKTLTKSRKNNSNLSRCISNDWETK